MASKLGRPKTYGMELFGFPHDRNPGYTTREDCKVPLFFKGGAGVIKAGLALHDGPKIDSIISVHQRGYPHLNKGPKLAWRMAGYSRLETEQLERDTVRAALMAALAQLDEIESRLF